MSQDIDRVRVEVNPDITPEQLFSFYDRNNCCETGYGIDVATRVLQHSSLIIGAFEADKLVGLARAMFDGVAASIMEFSLELKYQSQGMESGNGSLIGKDESGLGKKIGSLLIQTLLAMGAKFITFYIVENCEEPFYESLGFKWNRGHLVYYIDRRPYVNWESSG
jgi:hypothetical protein